jgi:hypothetical protein
MRFPGISPSRKFQHYAAPENLFNLMIFLAFSSFLAQALQIAQLRGAEIKKFKCQRGEFAFFPQRRAPNAPRLIACSHMSTRLLYTWHSRRAFMAINSFLASFFFSLPASRLGKCTRG